MVDDNVDGEHINIKKDMVSRKKPWWELGRHDKEDVKDAPKDIVDVGHVNIKNLFMDAIERNIDDYMDKKRVNIDNKIMDVVKEDIGDHIDIVDKKHVNIENSVVGVAEVTRVSDAWETVIDVDQQDASCSLGSKGEESIFVVDQMGVILTDTDIRNFKHVEQQKAVVNKDGSVYSMTCGIDLRGLEISDVTGKNVENISGEKFGDRCKGSISKERFGGLIAEGRMISAVVKQFKDKIFKFGEMNNFVEGEDGVGVGLQDDRSVVESVDEFAVDPGVFPWRARGAVRPLQTCVGEFRCELSEAVGGESDRTRHVGSTRPKNRWSDGRRLEVRTKGTGSLKAMNRWAMIDESFA